METTTKNPDAGSTANSGLNLIQALNTVLNAQNSLIQNWVSYETDRLNIHRDMGTMDVDETGLWVDEYYQQLRNESPPLQSEVIPPTGTAESSETFLPNETLLLPAPPAPSETSDEPALETPVIAPPD